VSIPGDSQAVIAPFWQELVLGASPMSDICTAVVGAAPARRVVIQWQNAQAFSAEKNETRGLGLGPDGGYGAVG